MTIRQRPEARASATKKRPRKTRAEKAVENRQRLLHSAVDVIGEHGYAGASVTRIAQKAGLAQGTFYLYFQSRQELFDQLLPEVGGEALAFIREAVGDAPDFVTMEARGLRGFFQYVVRNPAYFRVFTEAQVAAPAAYRKYTSDRTGRFLDSLLAAWRNGEADGYTERELGVLTQVMLAARTYLFHEYAKANGDGLQPPPDWVIKAYTKFIGRALGGTPAPAPASASAPASERGARRPR